MTRPPLDLTDPQRRERALEQAKESKRRRVALVARMRSEGASLCKHRHCITAPEPNGYCDRHGGHHRTEAPCIKCGCIAVPGTKLCGYCTEVSEERTLETRRINRRNRRRALQEVS